MACYISYGTCSVIGRKPPTEYVGDIRRNWETQEEYISFLGVPYAKKPEGEKRYQAPESLTWEPNPDLRVPVYRANVRNKCSAQFFNGRFEGSMDCLYLNIFLPRKPEQIGTPLPVLVFIHGGGFVFGSNEAEIITPDSIVQHEVIFVTINYRLGPIGFLNLHKERCPGNAGLKDQVKALEWIRDNIDCFKGDPGNVTLSGSSAGATCVNLHLMAPASQDLFHKAIVQSGGVYSLMGYRGHRREQMNVLLRNWEVRRALLAEEDSQRFHVRANDAVNQDRNMRHALAFSPLFGPTRETIADGAFIAEGLEEMMKKVKHDKPIMAGITREEGIYLLLTLHKQESVVKWVHSDDDFRQILMDNLRWSYATAQRLVEVIRNKYFPNRLNMSTVDKNRSFAKLVHDICFRRFYDNFRFGPEKAVHKNLYVYQFDHFSEICCAHRDNMTDFHEPTHADDLKYLYCPYILRRDFKQYIDQNTEIPLVTKHMCSLWANFCKTGVPKSDVQPNVEWRRHSEEAPCYLSINKNLTLKEEFLFKERWDWLNHIVGPQPVVESSPPSPT